MELITTKQFLNILEKSGVSIYEFSKQYGIPKERIYKWKQGKGQPKSDDLRIINSFIEKLGEQVPREIKQPYQKTRQKYRPLASRGFGVEIAGMGII